MTTDAVTTGVTQGRVVRSEWIKLWSLRSSTIGLLSTVVVLIGLGVVVCLAAADDLLAPAGEGGPPFVPADAMAATLGGLPFAQLVLGVLGALVMTGEYSTGMIRSSMAAVQTRLPVLWAKTIVFAAVAFVLMAVAATIAYLLGRMVLQSQGVAVDPAAGDVVRVLAGAAFYLTGTGLLGLAIGSLLRNAAAAIGALFGLVFLLPNLIGLLLPGTLGDTVGRYLPSNAGESFYALQPGSDLLSAPVGLAVFCAWLVVALGSAAFLLRHRDV